jgi:hypothetical protein
VDKLTRSQVVELAEQYRLLDKAKAADDLLTTWLTLRQRGLDPDDTEGLLGLSEDFRQLLRRDDLANRLLIDGWSRNPKAADLSERLEKAGYHLFDGQWLSDTEFNNRPEGKLEKAIRAGLVEPGMTASQARRSRGQPDAISRSASAGQVLELWTFKNADGTKLIVRLVRRAAQSEMAVAEVTEDPGEL